MIGLKHTFRNSESNTYQDCVFDNAINCHVKQCEGAYEGMMFRGAVKAGFYDLQASRGRYREMTAAGDGMNWQLLKRFIKVGIGSHF